MRRPFLAYGLNAIILAFVRKSVDLYSLFVRINASFAHLFVGINVSFAHLFIKNSVLIRFIQYRQARGCASPFCRNINKTLNGLHPLQRCMGGKRRFSRRRTIACSLC